MKIVLFILLLTLIPNLLRFIDRKIRGEGDIFNKIFNVLSVSLSLFLLLYLYGVRVLEAFNVNSSSFSNVKLFTVSRVIAIISILLLFLYVVFSLVFVSIKLNNKNSVSFTKAEATTLVSLVVLDIFVVPNIFSTVFGAKVLSMITIIGVGLVVIKLVFSIFNRGKMEAILC